MLNSHSNLLGKLADISDFVHERTSSSEWDPQKADSFPDAVHQIADAVCEQILVSDACTVANTRKYRRIFLMEDVKYLILDKILNKLSTSSDDISEAYVEKVLSLMRRIPVLSKNTSRKYSCSYAGASWALRKRFKYRNSIKIYSEIWLRMTKFPLYSKTRRRMLILLTDRVLPAVPNAVLFADFVFRSFQMGDPYNVLAVGALFHLIQHHNLEYPEFYAEIYSMVKPEICFGIYRKRLFRIVNLVLSSTHLPVYLVAAFAKRLSRLLLLAPVDCCQPLLDLISNLLVRHAELPALLQCPDAVEEDVYDSEEPDPASTGALQSCLWEVKTLQSHWLPDVSRKAKFLIEEVPKIENELHWPDLDKVWNRELAAEVENEVPVTFVPPKQLFDSQILNVAL